MKIVFTVLSLFLVTAPIHASECPHHEQHKADVNRSSDQAMGFDHTKTTHHFYLTPEGGMIEAESKNPADTISQSQIREHFEHITKMFSEGNFELPMLIHAQVPPGVPVMKRLKFDIEYRTEETKQGGRVRITTTNKEALSAIHEFLRFQIQDHKTGDPM